MEARTPDDSQLIQIGGTGANIPSGGDEPDAPPGLYTAIQEQLGLKLEPVSQTLSLLIMPRNPQPFSELNRSRTPEYGARSTGRCNTGLEFTRGWATVVDGSS